MLQPWLHHCSIRHPIDRLDLIPVWTRSTSTAHHQARYFKQANTHFAFALRVILRRTHQGAHGQPTKNRSSSPTPTSMAKSTHYYYIHSAHRDARVVSKSTEKNGKWNLPKNGALFYDDLLIMAFSEGSELASAAMGGQVCGFFFAIKLTNRTVG